MNSLRDVRKIVVDYCVRGGQVIENATDVSAADNAIGLFNEGIKQLDALNLPRRQRRDLKLLRQSFETFIKAAEALKSNNKQEAILLIRKAERYGARYVRRSVN